MSSLLPAKALEKIVELIPIEVRRQLSELADAAARMLVKVWPVPVRWPG